MVKRILSVLALFLSISVLSLSAQVRLTADDMRVHPDRALAGHFPYEAPVFQDTPPPAGYNPVYVSHFSRHGSRYQTTLSIFTGVLGTLDTLHKASLLTPEGDSLRRDLQKMLEIHVGNEGRLSRRGGDEHQAVASRLCHRVPGLFAQKEAAEVKAVSTSTQRTRESMNRFLSELTREFPHLDVVSGIEANDSPALVRVSQDDATKKRIRDSYIPVRDSLLAASSVPAALFARLVSDPSAAASCLGTTSPELFVVDLFSAIQGAGCLDLPFEPLRYFTPDDLLLFLQNRNAAFCSKYGPAASTLEARSQAAAPLLRSMILDADRALVGNGRCADFRFGHDGGLGPLLLLMGVEGYDRPLTRSETVDWQAWEYIPMCGNVQLIFYRGKRGQDVLVKVLRNEKETTIPGMAPAGGPYYRWKDLRRYLLSRTHDYVRLPSYYPVYLDTKAREIASLQKHEACGFFYYTDSHFPDNEGHAAPVLEYLQDKLGVRRVFFGGDATLNGKSMKEGMSLFISSLMQAGAGMLYPVRGNHDFVSHTHETHPSEFFNDAQVSGFLGMFRGVGTVSGGDGVNYYYIDDKKGKVRLVVLDSTDSVSPEGRVVYGFSPAQQEWLQETVMDRLPKGWSVLFLSHVPLGRNHIRYASIIHTGEMIRDFSADHRVLLCLSGHRHNDYESGLGSVFQVLTAADRLINSSNVATPYSPVVRKTAGTVQEQTLDYVSVSRKHDRVTMLRIGSGQDRIFNVRPVVLKAGDKVRLRPSLKGELRWFVFDAESWTIKKENGKDTFDGPSTVASVSPRGTVTAMSCGQAVSVAVDAAGRKEFFMISCN